MALEIPVVSSWREAARRIPTWEGAMVYGVISAGRLAPKTVHVRVERFRFGAPAMITRRFVRTGQVECVEIKDVMLDLVDRDTWRGAVDRLALRLGAPEHVVRSGVSFFWDPHLEQWTLFAHASYSWRAKIDTEHPRMALVSWWLHLMEAGDLVPVSPESPPAEQDHPMLTVFRDVVEHTLRVARNAATDQRRIAAIGEVDAEVLAIEALQRHQLV